MRLIQTRCHQLSPIWFILVLAVASISSVFGDDAMRWRWLAGASNAVPRIESCPLVIGDTAYFGVAFDTVQPSGAFVALTDLSTSSPRLAWPSIPFDDSIEASPTLGPNGLIYIGCLNGKFYAVDPHKHAIAWSYDTNEDFGLATYIHSTAAISPDGNVVYVGVGTFTDSDTGTGPGALYAFTADGKLWRHPLDSSIDGSPAVSGQGDIYVGSMDGTVYAITANNEERWSRKLDTTIFASPAIGGDGTVYIGTIGRQFVALTPDNALLWTFPTAVTAPAAVGPDGTVFLGSFDDAYLYALDPDPNASVRVKWKQLAFAGSGASPAIRADQTVLIGGDDGILRSFQAADGTPGWTVDTRQRINSCPQVAESPDHSIYIGGGAGYLCAITENASPLSPYASWPMFQRSGTHSGRADQPNIGATVVNLSARGQVTPADPLIAGFVVEGTAPKTILARGVGPALGAFGVQNTAVNPALTIHISRSPSFVLAANDDWGRSDQLAEIERYTAATGAFPLPPGSLDAAVTTNAVEQLGGYTAVVSNTEPGAKVVLAELYDTAPSLTESRLANISARATVASGENALILGIVVGGTGRVRVLLRGIGPSLGSLGVGHPLSSTRITVYDSKGRAIATNADWTSNDMGKDIAAIARLAGAFAIPESSNESGLVLTLEPGIYTIVLSSRNGIAGTGLAELYTLPF